MFNFEGGCYAKVINLDKESEPDIYNAIKRNALLENVTVDANGKIDFADKSVTENTRVSYPIFHINNIQPGSSAPAAKQVIINTGYGGEMKKGMFSMMNYFLPLKGIASMHCSANCDMNGENTAIFFGLSGTGKTTLSTDP